LPNVEFCELLVEPERSGAHEYIYRGPLNGPRARPVG